LVTRRIRNAALSLVNRNPWNFVLLTARYNQRAHIRSAIAHNLVWQRPDHASAAAQQIDSCQCRREKTRSRWRQNKQFSGGYTALTHLWVLRASRHRRTLRAIRAANRKI
jgi:hypothetical protein